MCKSSFFSGPSTKRGGCKGPATKEKRTFFYIFIYFSPKIVENFFCQNPFPLFLDEKKNPMSTKPRGWEVKALVATKKTNTFLRLP